METENREPFPLPIKKDKNKRKKVTKMYASLIWRETDILKIQTILLKMYEQAYSDGILANEQIHKTIDQ